MIHFISFGNSIYYNSLKRIHNQAKQMNIFSNILIITDKILEKRCHIFWNKHKNFILKNNRGYGYWLWKSFIILKTLESIDEEDIIVYADSGCSLNINGLNRLNEYFDIVKNSKYGILTFETPFIEKQYTKRDVFDHMNLNNNESLNSKHLIATIIILKKCEHTMKIINEWYEICCNYQLIDDSPSILLNDISFIEHRHDQSIFSLLVKKYGSEILLDETYFSNFNSEGKKYPIWATRLK
jgi:hypothetical protein